MWASKEYGAKSYFSQEYDKIKSSHNKIPHWSVLKVLKIQVLDENKWDEWYNWVKDQYKDAPKLDNFIKN